MKLRGQSTIDALILTAALNNEFGVTRARLAQELVLTYRRVNKHCEELVQKCLLEYNPVTRTYHATPLGKEIVKLTEQLAVHYTPVNSMLAKYKLRLDEGKMKTRDHARRVLKETYANSKSKLSVFTASFLLLENSFMHLHDCLLEALPCWEWCETVDNQDMQKRDSDALSALYISYRVKNSERRNGPGHKKE